jgi:hypothetical protein
MFVPHAARGTGLGVCFSYSGIGLTMTACLMACNGWSYELVAGGYQPQ